MNRPFVTFWSASAIVVATALALVAAPILGFAVLLAMLAPVAVSVFHRGRGATTTRVASRPPPDAVAR